MPAQTRLLIIDGQLRALSALRARSAPHTTLIIWKRRECAPSRPCDTRA